MTLLLGDAFTGKTETLLTEKDDYWINLSDNWHFFKDGKTFLWSSQRNNNRQLFLYDSTGKQIRQLTREDREVIRVDAVDEASRTIYYTGTGKTPLTRRVYRVGVDAGEPAALTPDDGTHDAYFSPDTSAFFDSYSTSALPGQASIASVQESEGLPSFVSVGEDLLPTDASSTAMAPEESANSPHLQKVEFQSLQLHLGTSVHTFMIKPPDFDPARKYPVIVCLAGGPGEQLVRDAWGGPSTLWMQYMAQKGYVIFAMDNQGTSGRGHYFEEPIHLRLGAQEMTDQRDGIEFLKRQPFIDTTRMGVFGWGYGGFLAVHAMLDRPVPFKAGFAGAAVTDWHLYDAVFAERYLDDPVAHADGWDASTSLDNAHFLKGTLMLAQGTADEAVHVENLLTLQDRLVDGGKTAQVLLFPDRGHRIQDAPARLLLYSSLTDFFVKNL